ncbi:hypothetical protein IMG5_200960 [Ichthyophthirius multifiliis]|uniref:Cytoplasmic tRNA 2-thiolation protein 1 n=1 Tax=Ichthyophthirius multifiliis TaxID=5932 RepID=G0R5T5_ICHMU|nr:hypothetical protein IMG5_200960 [Ichthyophthirius multifiliis]EGR27156.1 hypothetical protein IMG5_200960 [Ichthyophthirius multifiliis]|eukprot:XP_004024040.1 hypothetical protein IMG5_200960 [Ichthyophthirius multifiliis]
MVKFCQTCNEKRAFIVRPKTGKLICQECFFQAFEEEIHYTIISNNLFQKGQRIAMGASGGKDSTVLIHVMNLLNKKYNYGLDLQLLSIDEGITGYRDDSLETVKDNQHTYGLPLKILSYKELYGWTMDEIVKQIGLNNNCTFCGVFRRQSLDRGAQLLKCDKILTGHNADDIAETILMNMARGDFFRLGRCVQISTGQEVDDDHIPRLKPFKYTYEKEIVLYAYHKKLVYFSTECIYSPNAYRGHVRELIKNLEKVRPSSIIDIIHSAEQITININAKMPKKMKCIQCGFVSSNDICKACILLERLNKGKAKIEIKAE